MMLELFSLDFTRWEVVLLSLLPAIINFLIFIYTSVFIPQNNSTRSFSIFVFLLGLWQIAEAFIKMSYTAEQALEWKRISVLIIPVVIAAGIYFVLDYTHWKKKLAVNLLFFLVFIPVLTCLFIVVARLDSYVAIFSSKWYWVLNPLPSYYTGIIYFLTSLGALLMLAMLLFHHWEARANEIKRKRALLLLIGFSIPAISGIVAEGMFPLLLGIDNLPVTNSLLTIFSITTLIAIRKFGIFEYSPNYLWTRIKDTLKEGVVIVDNKELVVYANKEFCKLLEYNFEQIENKNINEILFGSEDAGFGKVGKRGEVHITAQNGKKIWVLVSGSAYIDDKGNTLGTIILLANISERVELEENLKASNHDLKTFIYRLSHDLRTPLTSVMGLTELAKLEISDAKASEYFGYIDGLTKNMDHLLLTLIQVMSVRDHSLKINEVDAGELVYEIVRSLRYTEEYDSINFLIDKQLNTPIQTDRTLLHSILYNLIENAIKYRKRELLKPQITIHLTEDAKNVLIEVIDNGIGIKKEVQGNLFDMFFRASNLSVGSGLGLYMVKTSVDRLGGSVFLESQVAKGTTFTVVLPKQ